jgi:hypothetical protein
VVPLWLILLGVVLGRVGILAWENHLFATEARHVQGTVVTKYLLSARGRHDDVIPVVIYSYTTDHLQGRCATEVTFETYNIFKVGGPIPVAYLPGDPTDNRLNLPWETLGFVWGPYDDSIVAAFVFVPGACLVWYFASRNRIHARLKAVGTNCMGEVIALNKTHHRCASDTYLTFRFTTPAGREILGRTPPLRTLERTHWQKGDPIPVFFDPKKPEHFAVDTEHPLDVLLADEPAPAPLWQTIWA